MLFTDLYYYLTDLPRWHIFAIFLVGYFIYYLIEVVKRPILAVNNGPFKDYLLMKVPTLQTKFWPTFWCVECHAQTAFACFLRRLLLPHFVYRRELLTLKDGGEIALDWMENGCGKESPVILFLPGLTGESQSEYIKCLVAAANSLGARVVVFNNRGFGGVALKTPRFYCASNVEDLVEALHHIKKLCPNSKIGATGISVGGLLLGNYLATHSEEARNIFTACKIISVPWNVQKGTLCIEKPYLNRVLGKYLANALCETLSQNKILDKSQDDIDFDTIFKSKTIKEFDTYFTTKHFGFRDVDHYYTEASVHTKLHQISIPLLCLNAADDPLQPLEAIPMLEAEESSHVAIAVTARGGHLGFMDGVWPRTSDEYMARLFSQYFGATLFDNEFEDISKKMMETYPRRPCHEHTD